MGIHSVADIATGAVASASPTTSQPSPPAKECHVAGANRRNHRIARLQIPQVLLSPHPLANIDAELLAGVLPLCVVQNHADPKPISAL